jgi:hypothetical protein
VRRHLGEKLKVKRLNDEVSTPYTKKKNHMPKQENEKSENVER